MLPPPAYAITHRDVDGELGDHGGWSVRFPTVGGTIDRG
jgi:hypothetical protein